MAVYYKFKSAKDYDSIFIDSHFISVSNLKERIFESKHLGRGTDHDLEVINAQTNEEYLDEAMLIPKNTSVLIRRVPGRFHRQIATRPEESKIEHRPEDDVLKVNYTSAVSNVKDLEPPEWDDEFGQDLYASIPEVSSVQASNPIREDPPPSKIDEDSKIKALIETPALNWQSQGAEGFGPGRGFGRGGRMMGGRGFGRFGERKVPPQGYVCHRCKVPGHYIQLCPTNGDANFDIRKVTAPTGIPRTMLMANPDGTIAMPSGAVGVLQPNEAAFAKEMEGISSTRSLGDLPPELHCPLCKEVMKDAVLTSKCCFTSFCDKCIRDHLITKSVCVCGIKDVLADDLLPNKTLRDTISRILSSTNSSGDNAGSALHVQDMESARCPQPKVASPTQSTAVKEEHVPPASKKETSKPKETEIVERSTNAPPQPQTQLNFDKLKTDKVPDISEPTHESASAKETASHGSALPAEEEVQQKMEAAEVKKKKKKTRLPANATDMQWRTAPDFAADSYMVPMAHSAYNPYWTGGIQHGMDGYMNSFGGGMPYNMGYGVCRPMDMPFPGFIPHHPYVTQNHMFPMMPPQRGFNVRPPLMTREVFEARKTDVRRMGEREMPKDRDHGGEFSSSVNALSMKSKPCLSVNKTVRREPNDEHYNQERDHHRNNNNYDRHERKPDHHHHHHQRSVSSSKPPSSEALQRPNSPAPNVFSRISFSEKGGEQYNKKRRRSPSNKESAHPSNGDMAVSSSSSMMRKSHVMYESSDDDDEDRHFKRRPSKYRERERGAHSSRHR